MILFIGLIMFVEFQERKKDVLYIIVNNATGSDIELIINNGAKINRFFVNGLSIDNRIDIPFKWGKKIHFELNVNNKIISEISLDLGSDNVAGASASGGGLITYMNIGMDDNIYEIKFSGYKSKDLEDAWKAYIESGILDDLLNFFYRN
jgi:hypothetical protein